jgi:hypothetical protein
VFGKKYNTKRRKKGDLIPKERGFGCAFFSHVSPQNFTLTSKAASFGGALRAQKS